MGPKEEAAPASMEENTLACVGSVTLLLVKNDTLCNWFLKKKKRERKRLPALQGLTAPSYDQVPNPFLLNLRPSFHEFIPHVISNWKNKNRVFFSSVSKKKKKESSDSLPIAEEKPFVLMEQGV